MLRRLNPFRVVAVWLVCGTTFAFAQAAQAPDAKKEAPKAPAAKNEAPKAPAATKEAPKPLPQGTAVSSTRATATVTELDQKSRVITLKTSDGVAHTFVVDAAVKNLPQVNVGDTVVATYTEALAYEVKKGGKAGATEAVAGGTAAPGKTPAGAVARQVTVTVSIVAIDPSVPSVTFKGPQGNTRTIKIRDPKKLDGVSVGDTVELTYTEALALKIEKAAAKK